MWWPPRFCVEQQQAGCQALVHLQLRVERIAQPVAEEVEADERHREDDRGEEELMRERAHVTDPFGDKDAPARKRRANAETEKRQPGLGCDRPWYPESRGDDHRGEC